MHEYLALVIGFERVPGDSRSAEQPLDTLALMGSRGFALDPDEGWLPQMPALKDGGVWAESSTSLGRTLIAGSDGNVTESMRLVVGTGDPLALHSYIVKLNRFIEMARRYWATTYQVLPVYLKWKAISGAGYQYALVYNIDATVEYPGNENSGVVDVTLSVEREPYWRAIAPGANPKLYYYEKNKLAWNLANASLISGNDHWAVDTVENEQSWFASYGAENSKPYIEISGIPGDAPALMSLEFNGGSTNYNITKIYAARETKNTPLAVRSISSSIGIRRVNILNAANAGSISADSPRVADTGAPIYTSTQTRQRREVTFTTTASNALRASFGTPENFNFATMRGKYAVLARMRQVNGSFGHVTVSLVFKQGDFIAATLRANPILSGTNGNTAGWPITYFGDITLPPIGTQIPSSDGYGEAVQEFASGILEIWAERSTGTANVYLADIIFLPFDEGLFSIEATAFNSGATPYYTIVDNTGYSSRGTEGAVAYVFQSGSGPANIAQIRGDVFTLQPGVRNRIYLLTVGTFSGVADRSQVPENATVRVNIVPRWQGVRDA